MIMRTSNSTAITIPTTIPPISPAEIASLLTLCGVLGLVGGSLVLVGGSLVLLLLVTTAVVLVVLVVGGSVGRTGQSGARRLARDTGQVGST